MVAKTAIRTGSDLGGAQTRKTAIADSACRAVERKGVRDLRVEDVAAEAGVSPALVYYYFGTRDALLAETFSHSNALSAAETDRRLKPSATARGTLEQFLLLELTEVWAVRQNWVVWTEMLGSALFDPTISALLAEVTDAWVAQIEALVRAGREDGSIGPGASPSDAAELLTSVLDGVGTKWMLGHMTARRARSLVREAIARELDG
jgi:AcrR family transcriptional regulator